MAWAAYSQVPANPDRNTFGTFDLRLVQWKDSTVSGVRASLVLPQSSEYIPRVCYPYHSTAPRPGLSHKLIRKDQIASINGANYTSCTSAGTILCLTMRFCIVLACSTSPTSSVNEDWVSLVMSLDFKVMHRQTKSSEFVPKRGTVAFAGVETHQWSSTHHLDPLDLPWHGCYSDGGTGASRG